MQKIIIGSRGSKLSIIQTELVQHMLQDLFPKSTITIKTITTKGDKNMSPVPLDSIGKGWFTKEIDRELLNGSIDVAVHSLKDLPEVLPEGLMIAAIPQREDAREALVSSNNVILSQLPNGSIIGTDSSRRKSQILHKYPDLVVESVRGNVLTRLEKLDSGLYDALFLAVAGLKRLGLSHRITEYFPITDIISSPGQGALAVVIKESNKALAKVLSTINDPQTVLAVDAERAFSKAVGGGCKMPVGAYAECIGKTFIMHGVIGSLDGSKIEKQTIQGKTKDALQLAEQLAKNILDKSTSWYQKIDDFPQRYVVITRPGLSDNSLQKEIEKIGLQTFVYPTIKIEKNELKPKMKKALQDLATFDWILLTSRNGVTFLMEALQELGIATTILKKKKIGAVGTKTKEEIERYGFQVDFIPSHFTTETLGQEIEDVQRKNILLPRSNIASSKLTRILEDRGANVTNIPIYRTEYMYQESPEFLGLLHDGKVHMITFTSPSTIEGFLRSVPEKFHQAIFGLPILSIGPVTAKAAKKHGFTNITTADTYTVQGMILKLKQSILY